MKNSLHYLSKTLYILSFVALFLPAFIPSCSSEKASSVCPDTIATISSDTAVIKVDLLMAAKNTSGVVLPVKEEKKEISSEDRTIFFPDGHHLSFWGYLWFSFEYALVWGFAVLFFYSGILRFRNKNQKSIAVMSLIGFGCLTLYWLDKEVVRGFWVTYGAFLFLTIINGFNYFQEIKNKRKLLLNKF